MQKVLLALFSLFILSMGCQAASEVKAGGEGEFCSGADIDCRVGYICQDNACRGQEGTTPEYSCSAICSRLDACGTQEPDCLDSCKATFDGQCSGTACPWNTEAKTAFGKCIVDDLDCEEARQNGPDICYGRLPIESNREARCDAFVAAANRCGANQTNTLNTGCTLLAKTATDTSWARTDACIDRIAADDCNSAADCFNTVFNLSPPISFLDSTNNNNITFE